MKVKDLLFVLMLVSLFVNCSGKNRQPKLESLWETDIMEEEAPSSGDFIVPDLSREKDIDKDSLAIHTRISPYTQSIENYSVIDSAVYIVMYDVRVIHNPKNPDDKLTDLYTLQIGNTVSKTYSDYLFQTDSIDAEMRKSGMRVLAAVNYFPEDIYKNYPEGKVTVSHRSCQGGPILMYEERIPEFDWKISGETRQILSYSCQKAITTFRGRNYEAWFTPDIPLQEGPWKFRGLPGLILEVYDTQNQYFFTCKSFRELKSVVPIKFWAWDYKHTTRETLDKFLRQAYNNPQGYLELYNKKLLELNIFKNISNTVFAYNPLELE